MATQTKEKLARQIDRLREQEKAHRKRIRELDDRHIIRAARAVMRSRKWDAEKMIAELNEMAAQAPRKVEEEQSRREPRSSSNLEPPHFEAQVHSKLPQR